MRRLSVAIATVAFFGITAAAIADWPCFLGPNHDSTSDETGFKKESKEPLKMLWDRKIGSAFSSFAAAGDRVYTCGMADNQQVLYCLNGDTGAVIWQKPFEKEYRNEHGDGTRATPNVNDGKVYILGAHGKLLCVDAETGSDAWEKQFRSKPTWGYSGSVLVEGNLAIASAGGSEGALTAFDKATGNLIWRSGDDQVGYATPYPLTLDGQRYVVGFLGNSASIVDAKTGRPMWKLAWRTDWDVNAASPIFHDGYLFLGSGYTTGCALLKLARSQEGEGEEKHDTITHTVVWQNTVLMNKFQSCVLHDGKLFGSDQNALKCVDFMTGKELWKKPKVRNGTLLIADGHLLLLTEDGRLQIAKPSAEDFVPLTDAQILDGRCWTQPVLHRGRLYARNLERVACFDLR